MRSPRAALAAAAVLVLVLAWPVPADVVKTDEAAEGPGKVLLSRPDPTTAGSFDGSWMYVNRDARFALWIRTKDGVSQAKVQYQSLASPEAFETDWDGKAVYYLASHQVTFELKLGKSTSDQILGTWAWDFNLDDSGRHEKADVVMYRTQFGRNLVMDFQNYEKTIRRGGKDAVWKAPVNWTFAKISKRELLWDEFPF